MQITLDRRTKRALKLAIASLTDRRRKWAACPHAAELGFEFGKHGLVRYKECDDAIKLFSEWLEQETPKKAEKAEETWKLF